MRTTARAVLAVAVALAAILGITATADAEKHKPLPTKSEVAHARDEVKRKAGDVASIRAALAVATNRLESAAERAEIASEAYNGAQWQLGEAKKATAKATRAAGAAAQKLATQRAGIVAIANQTYQDGTVLSGLSAFLGQGGGPEEVMGRVGVVQSATESMQAKYDGYAAASTLAKVTRASAETAEREQVVLAQKAEKLRNNAAAAVLSAQDEARAIAAQRQKLIRELASAQKISVKLATQRQRGLEEIAQARAAAAARKKAEAAAAVAAAAAQAAQVAADKAADKSDDKSDDKGAKGDDSAGGPSAPTSDPSPPAAAGSGAAARAIAFAKDQLGEQYLWAAAGPSRWDCSGLTMMAWRQGGVSLPHYSVAQYAQTEHIGVGDLRPGDLVFWGDSPGSIHHVAMYIGNGQIIHAPRTGRPVEIDSMYYWIPPNYFGRP
ncbi:MAG: NlpC/P60 family protein [Marmoricola sp.]|nr:NlpC/P60 family protein [Marmoricola sp.]